MRVLVVGGGGREHALVWKIRQSPKVSQIYCAPGNGGIQEIAQCVDIAAQDIDKLLEFALTEKIDLTVVGPEVPLALGIVDKFREKGLRIFGPSQKAAEIEGSKAFAKNLMAKYHIPTAQYRVFTDVEKAKDYIRELGVPCVVKADGLAAGKGVMVCFELEEALTAVEEILVDNKFGQAGSQVIVEEYLEGEEVSILAFTDGKNIVPMVSAQDHKRVFDNDQGPNTGGMGAYSPAPVYTSQVQKLVETEILQSTVQAMEKEGRPFQGVLYAGLMLTSMGPKVLEFNARFGDPETQVVLPRLKTDLVEIIEAVLDRKLDTVKIEWSSQAAVCVVLASAGYPGPYEKGKVITGIDKKIPGTYVFHAGTKLKEGRLITDGGRVLGVTALGDNLPEAINNAYNGVKMIDFSGMHYRRDIGKKAIR